MHNYFFVFLLFFMSPPTGCNKIDTTKENLPLQNISLPKGFTISLFAKEVENVRAITKSATASIYYAGSRGAGNVYALIDTNNDYVIDTTLTIVTNLSLPTGITWYKGDLYFSEINRILKISNIDEVYNKKPTFEIVNDELPNEEHHGWKYLKFGPDGKLYVPIGAPCNICKKEDKRFSSIMRMDADGSNTEIFVQGIRNSVGFDFHPDNGNLFFTDNGTDWMGDDKPLCELNKVSEKGQHFGYPYCHSGLWLDDKLAEDYTCEDFVKPFQNLGPHVAPLGMTFYTGLQFPTKYNNSIFIAEHGSWNRSTKIGYRVALVRLDEEGNSLGYEIFAEGWFKDGKVWGRPADIMQLPDGSLLVTDDFADVVYRIVYEEE